MPQFWISLMSGKFFYIFLIWFWNFGTMEIKWISLGGFSSSTFQNTIGSPCSIKVFVSFLCFFFSSPCAVFSSFHVWGSFKEFQIRWSNLLECGQCSLPGAVLTLGARQTQETLAMPGCISTLSYWSLYVLSLFVASS